MTQIVKVNLGFTRNLGNFNSARVDIGFEDNVRKDESVKEARERVYNEVENELMHRLEQVVAQIKEIAGG